MVVVTQHLTAPASLPKLVEPSLSVLSYNVLLPNSVDAWWTYKMYNPPVSEQNRHIASWEYRQNLLKERIGQIDADVVCLQEVSPTSFDQDFQFMQDLGYDAHQLFRKGRFRPATFWKTDRCQLLIQPAHKDRTLLTAFRLTPDVYPNNRHDSSDQNWFVLNCHLQAGKEARRRVRQIQEGTKAVITMANKLKVKDPTETACVIVCGDFNGGSESGAVRILEDGSVDENFLEDGEPVTSSTKKLVFQKPMIDVSAAATGREPPPTMVVSELISQMVDGGNGYENPKLSDTVIQKLKQIYQSYSTHDDGNGLKQMSTKDTENWLIKINGRLCRGDEYREAGRQMGWTEPPEAEGLSPDEVKKLVTVPQNSILTLEGFIQVYQRELERGKFWGIAHDLALLGEPLAHIGLFEARYDRMYCSSALKPVTVLDTMCATACPNEYEPSDHLPIAATFALN